MSSRFLTNVFKYKHRIVWSKNEVVKNNNQIIHATVKGVFKLNKNKKLKHKSREKALCFFEENRRRKGQFNNIFWRKYRIRCQIRSRR